MASLRHGSQRNLFTIFIYTGSTSGHGTSHGERFRIVAYQAAVHDIAYAEVERLTVEEQFQFLVCREIILVGIFGGKDLAVDAPAVEDEAVVRLCFQCQSSAIRIGCLRSLRSFIFGLLVLIFHCQDLYLSCFGIIESKVQVHRLVGLLNP